MSVLHPKDRIPNKGHFVACGTIPDAAGRKVKLVNAVLEWKVGAEDDKRRRMLVGRMLRARSGHWAACFLTKRSTPLEDGQYTLIILDSLTGEELEREELDPKGADAQRADAIEITFPDPNTLDQTFYAYGSDSADGATTISGVLRRNGHPDIPGNTIQGPPCWVVEFIGVEENNYQLVIEDDVGSEKIKTITVI